MDGIFNRVLIEYPELGVSLFMDMAAALSGEQFARFMLGQASLMDWARVISAMPKGPFLRQLLDV
jgi:lycopene beta-cyclase